MSRREMNRLVAPTSSITLIISAFQAACQDPSGARQGGEEQSKSGLDTELF
jgi:hypothetical protein